MLQHRPSKNDKTDGNKFKVFYEKECNILINPHWLSDTGTISLETCKSYKQIHAPQSFVYRICNSLEKYFLYLKGSMWIDLYILTNGMLQT